MKKAPVKQTAATMEGLSNEDDLSSLSAGECFLYGTIYPAVLFGVGAIVTLMILSIMDLNIKIPINLHLPGLVLIFLGFIGLCIYITCIAIFLVIAGSLPHRTENRAFLSGMIGIGIGILLPTLAITLLWLILSIVF